MCRWTACFGLVLAWAAILISTTSVAALPGADLRMLKTVSGGQTVAQGGEITYNLIVTNLGDDAANTITVTDALPPGTTFVSLAGGCCGQTVVNPAVGANGP